MSMSDKARPNRVLVVDDEPNVILVLSEVLEGMGENYLIETACDGREALEKVKRDRYTLVITDYKMPGMDGLDLAKEIRQIAPDTQVVMMTAFGNRKLHEAVEKLNLDGYIDKPFTMDQIREIVEEAAQRASLKERRNSKRHTTDSQVHERLQALQTNTGARCVLLISTSGFPIEIVGKAEELDLTGISALVAANFIASVELAKLLRSGSIFKSSYHEGPDYNIYSYAVNEDLLLAVIFGSESKPGLVWFYAKQTAADMASLVVDQAPRMDYNIENLPDIVSLELDQLIVKRGEEGDGPNRNSLFNIVEKAISSGPLPEALRGDRPKD